MADPMESLGRSLSGVRLGTERHANRPRSQISNPTSPRSQATPRRGNTSTYGNSAAICRPGSSYRADLLTELLPDDIVLGSLLPFLDATSLNRFPLLNRKTFRLYVDAFFPHLNGLWRKRCVADWGESAVSYFESNSSGKKTLDYEMLFKMNFNLHHGVYRFRTVGEVKDLAKRAVRLDVMNSVSGGDRFGIPVARARQIEVIVGQPTTVETGYAVNLRLANPHLLYTSANNVAITSAWDPLAPVRYISDHIGAIVSIAVAKELLVTSGEDGFCRVYLVPPHRGPGKAPMPKVLRTILAPDVLDVAIHGHTLVTYDNANVVKVFDLSADIARHHRSDDPEPRRDLAPRRTINLHNLVTNYLALRSMPLSAFAPDPSDQTTHEVEDPQPQRYPPLDPDTLNREVKIAVCESTLVCGFENTHFLVVDLGDCPFPGPPVETGSPTTRLTRRQARWPLLHHLHDASPLSSLDAVQRSNSGTYVSTSYPTVVQLSPLHLVTRSPRANELIVFSLATGSILHRLSESLTCLRATGFVPTSDPSTSEPNEGLEVVTDFAFCPESGTILCTIEDALGAVFLHLYDFGPGTTEKVRWAGIGGREKASWRFEKRSLEWSADAGDRYEYSNFWVGFREGGCW